MRILIAVLFAAFAIPANATFHLWYINEVYSNADGSVQFIELKAAASGQQFVRDHTIRATSGGQTHSYTLPTDLPGDSADGMTGDPYGYGGYGSNVVYKSFLIATQGYANLNTGAAPDYIVPNGFIFTAGGTLNWGENSDIWSYGALPTDGHSITRDKTQVTPSPTNFAGSIGTVAPPTQATPSYQGLWLRTPFTQESGWGINFTHQGNVLFATWFTYDTDGSGMWLVMSNGVQTSAGQFSGDVYRTTGPGFDNYTSAITSSNYTKVGTLSVTFSDPNTGSMTYTINGVTQTKPIGRYIYSTAPTCTVGGTVQLGTPVNYSDLWYRNESESGWGVNIVHQGDILFATWFTYQSGGTAAAPAKGMWLVMSNGNKTGNGVYTGDLQRTTGPNPFDNATPFDPSKVNRVTVGSATFTFSDSDNGTFQYTVNGITQSKPITRLKVAAPTTLCH